jgi:hypothetical protein
LFGRAWSSVWPQPVDQRGMPRFQRVDIREIGIKARATFIEGGL